MSYGNSIRHIPRIRSFAEAEAFYNKTPRPPRAKAWQEMPCARPLYKASTPHYSIVKVGDDVYNLVHFSTPLVQYRRPTGNECVIRLRHHNSVTSRSFLHHFWQYGTHRTTDGRTVHIPLSPRVGGDGWSATLVLVGNRLDVSRSHHVPVYVRRSNDADKERRATFRANVDALMLALSFRIPTFHASAQVTYHRGRAFAGGFYRDEAVALRRALVKADAPGWVVTEGAVEAASAVAAHFYSTSISKREFVARGGKWFALNPEEIAALEPLAPEKFMRPLREAIMRTLKLDRRSDKVALPQFPESLPRTYYY